MLILMRSNDVLSVHCTFELMTRFPSEELVFDCFILVLTSMCILEIMLLSKSLMCYRTVSNTGDIDQYCAAVGCHIVAIHQARQTLIPTTPCRWYLPTPKICFGLEIEASRRPILGPVGALVPIHLPVTVPVREGAHWPVRVPFVTSYHRSVTQNPGTLTVV